MFKLQIDTDNDAFHDDGQMVDELTRILKVAQYKLETGAVEGWLFDRNGNRVGGFELTED